jgi:hypothetical protein
VFGRLRAAVSAEHGQGEPVGGARVCARQLPWSPARHSRLWLRCVWGAYIVCTRTTSVCVCGGGGLCRPAAACFISVDERHKGLLNVWRSACRGCYSCACGGTFVCEVLEQSGPGQGAKASSSLTLCTSCDVEHYPDSNFQLCRGVLCCAGNCVPGC